MSDLAALRDLVEQDLDDAANDIWSTGDVDRAVKRALTEYSELNPQQSVTDFELSGGGREVDISSIGGLTRVVKVWYPYDSCAPESPPNWVRWDRWGSVLYISSGKTPEAGEKMRVYYHQAQTIEGLDGASSTTVPLEDEEVIVLGATAYAALQKARGAVGEAGVSTETPEHWLNWGLNRIEAFRDCLQKVRARELRRVDKRVPLYQNGWVRAGEEGGI